MSAIIKRPEIKSVDFCVDENIWGHRLHDEQLPHLTVLEFLGVLGSNLDRPLRLRAEDGGTVKFKPQRQIRLRGLLFNNPYVESIADGAASDEEKWRQWLDRFAQGATGNGSLSKILCVRHTMMSERRRYAQARTKDAKSQCGRASGGVAHDPAGVAGSVGQGANVGAGR